MSRVTTGEACHGATRALCDVCGALIDAKIVERAGRIFLSKWCEKHGKQEALTSSSASWYLNSLSYVKPGTEPLRRYQENPGECPESCGLCPRHEQHTCLPIIEITGQCDMNCPICLVNRKTIPKMSLLEFETVLDSLIECEGRLNMITLSGGEPTSHPRFLDIVRAAARHDGIGMVSVSTNGLRLDRDPELLDELAKIGCVLSLQFDGERPETYERLRGDASLAEVKLRLLEKLKARKIRTSLTMTMARGVNEGELSSILSRLFTAEHILSVMIQPLSQMSFRGGSMSDDPITIPDVVAEAARASGGVLKESDFTPLPCSHPSCFALTYLLKTDDGRLVPLPRIVDTDTYLDIIKNQALFNTDRDTLSTMTDALYALWSAGSQVPEQEAVLKTVKGIIKQLGSSGGRSPGAVLDTGVRHVKSIFIHHFMDRHNFDLSRAVKCCNHYPQKDKRLLPACVRNNLLTNQVEK